MKAADSGLSRPPRVRELTVEAFTLPTDAPEADGTLEWTATTIIVVEVVSDDDRLGVGYSYTDAAAAVLIHETLADLVVGTSVMDVPAAHARLLRAVRNLGRPGLVSTAIAAIDMALWDLKARVLGTPLVTLLGSVRESIPVYGSGGFTSYPIERLQSQLAGWASVGIGMVKMKVGHDAAADRERVRHAREAIGPQVALFVDANGAYDRRQALSQAEAFAHEDVCWFEEPVSSDDLDGLRFLRERTPAAMDVAAGEYGYDVWYMQRLLEARAVDVLQADATRCSVSGFLQAAALCDAWQIPLSAHTAPHVHAHLCCSATRARHVEYFHDHARLEDLFFDGALIPADGRLTPDRSVPGLGLTLKRPDVESYRHRFSYSHVAQERTRAE